MNTDLIVISGFAGLFAVNAHVAVICRGNVYRITFCMTPSFRIKIISDSDSDFRNQADRWPSWLLAFTTLRPF